MDRVTQLPQRPSPAAPAAPSARPQPAARPVAKPPQPAAGPVKTSLQATSPQTQESGIAAQIAAELGVQAWQVTAAVDLLDAGSTVPFIARYRKEATGTLDDTQLRDLEERLRYLRELEDRR